MVVGSGTPDLGPAECQRGRLVKARILALMLGRSGCQIKMTRRHAVDGARPAIGPA